MKDLINYRLGRPDLLVSVRNADEARAALTGGADVIDVKEPSSRTVGGGRCRGRGRCCSRGWRTCASQRGPGELLEVRGEVAPGAGIAFAKIGLAGCGRHVDWPQLWLAVIAKWPASTRPVAVVYADWHTAAAPPPVAVLTEAAATGCPALLIDTWDKSRGGLFDHWSAQEVAQFCQRTQAAGIAVVLAGSLQLDSLKFAVVCRPDLIAVRGAACDDGRLGTISAQRVRKLKRSLRSASKAGGDKLLSPATCNMLSAR